MALENKNANKPSAPVAPVTAQAGKKNDNELVQKGNQIISTMSAEQLAVLGSKSGTLHFQHLLGLKSKKADRMTKGKVAVDSFTPVGVSLVSDEEISIPQIDITKNKDTGIDAAKDITYVTVPAGQKFVLSYYEFMFLIIRDEYAGTCEVNGDAHGCYFSPKMPAFMAAKAKLPTPTINWKEGSPKETMVAIDLQNADGKWVIKPEFEAKFGALMRKAAPSRSQGKKTSIGTPVAVSVALNKILHGGK